MDAGNYEDVSGDSGSEAAPNANTPPQRATGMKCRHCGITVQGKTQLDTHRKGEHQAKVTVKTVELTRTTNTKVFGRPARGCTFTQKDPHRIQAHVVKCEGQKVQVRTMIREAESLAGTLIQHGDEIEGQQHSGIPHWLTQTHGPLAVNPLLLPYSFVWNKRTNILICDRFGPL